MSQGGGAEDESSQRTDAGIASAIRLNEVGAQQSIRALVSLSYRRGVWNRRPATRSELKIARPNVRMKIGIVDLTLTSFDTRQITVRDSYGQKDAQAIPSCCSMRDWSHCSQRSTTIPRSR